MPLPSMEELFTKLCTALGQLPRLDYEHGSGPSWTNRVLDCFRSTAPKDSTVIPAQADAGEWNNRDLLWCRGTPNQAGFQEVMLYVESEWAGNTRDWGIWEREVLNELHKLLLTDCDTKVLVTCLPEARASIDMEERALDFMRNATEGYGRHATGDLMYILISPSRVTKAVCRARGAIHYATLRSRAVLGPVDCLCAD